MYFQGIIDTYLVTLLKLSKASSVSLYLPQSNKVHPWPSSYFKGESLLSEFNNHSKENPLKLLNKLSLEKKHKEKLTIYPGKSPHTILLNLSPVMFQKLDHSPTPSQIQRLGRRSSENSMARCDEGFWLGFEFDGKVPECLEAGEFDLENQNITQESKLFKYLLNLGSHIISEVDDLIKLFSDPLTPLFGRVEFQSYVTHHLNQEEKLAIYLFKPLNLQEINKTFGHSCGDQVISEIGNILIENLRKSDCICRFGGALFAIATPVKNHTEVVNLAHKLQSFLQKAKYLDGAIELEFNIGISFEEEKSSANQTPENEYTVDLINRAVHALQSAQKGDRADIVLWQSNLPEKIQNQHDNIGSIFTSDTVNNYRNMLLLWDISNLIASYSKFDDLLGKSLERIGQTFNIEYGGIFEQPNEKLTTVEKYYHFNDAGLVSPVKAIHEDISNILLEVMKTVCQSQQGYLHKQGDTIIYAAPFFEKRKGIFFIIGKVDNLILPNDSQLLLNGLAQQLDRAHSKALLEEQLNKKLNHQKQKLETELSDLKKSVQGSLMLYGSQAMQSLMKKAKKSALTNTTTLIIGESGTGKERLVNAIHQMGPRAQLPLVIVDCGAIPDTLIESELFGHVKGAFTGAHSQANGRILEADGGTLVLDEIGEVPLQLQSKLLRFVQEKQITPVGSAKTLKVDVKIIAVTNRELQFEVDEGRFRKDLFYRLNVLQLHTPTLSERAEDIELLARHFLKKFSIEFNESVKSLSHDTIKAMQQYSWPGNVRELENRLMQANLFCDGDIIEFSDLNIQALAPQRPRELSPILQEKSFETNSTDEVFSLIDAPVNSTPLYLEEIKHTFSDFISMILNGTLASQTPMGSWLEIDLICMTFQACNENGRQAALRLGIAHSTFRRRLNSSKDEKQSRVQGWDNIINILTPMAEGHVSLGDDSLKKLKTVLITCILEKIPNKPELSSALLGVSGPTFYKLKKSLTLVS